MTDAVNLWWSFLRVAASLNILLWLYSALHLARRHASFFSAPAYRLRRLLLWLSAIYVLGCAYRSFLPQIDLTRICLEQSFWSNVLISRSLATVAELSFMGQCALLLYHAGMGRSCRVIGLSQLLLPLIVLAELACWYAVLSGNYLGHVLENSLWTFSALLILLCFFMLWGVSKQNQKKFIGIMMLFALGYIAFMLSFDVPMYWQRWQAALALGKPNSNLLQGLYDAAQPCHVDFSWNTWRLEIPWLSLYFTVAVWVSIALPHAPGWINGDSDSTKANAAKQNASV